MLFIKLNLITSHRKKLKPYIEYLSWLIFKLTIFLIKLCFFFISHFSQSTIGCFILLCMFCSFYSTDNGYVIVNSILDILIQIFPKIGLKTFKNTLINIGNTKTKALALLNFGYKNINHIKTTLNRFNETTEHLISFGNTVSEHVTDFGNKVTTLGITAEKTKDALTAGLAIIAAQQVANNLQNDEMYSMMKKLFSKVIDLEQHVHELKLKNANLERSLEAIETNTQKISMESKTHTKLITNIGEGLNTNEKEVNHLLRQLLSNTENMQKIMPDLEKLFLANQETNGKLFKELIQAIKNGNNIESFFKTFIANNAIGTTFTVSKQFIKYFSEMTGIGANAILNDDTRHRIGLGGTRKQCSKRNQTKSKRK